MSWRTYLELGRVSNLPTVVSNICVGLAVNGFTTNWQTIVLGTGAIICLYVAGMYLNDYCDREVDAFERPTRPIPAGRISAQKVIIIAAVLFSLALISLALVHSKALFAGVILVIFIVLYDYLHKRFTLSPLIMAGCRFMVYVIGAFLASYELNTSIFLFAGLAFAYLTGLTHIARLEHLNQIKSLWPLVLLFVPILGVAAITSATYWKYLAILPILGCVLVSVNRLLGKTRNVGKSIALLIAGISLVDALFLATLDQIIYIPIAILCFVVTLLLHRIVPGT